MMKDIISLVIHEAKKRPGADLAEKLTDVWVEIFDVLFEIEQQIAAINYSDMTGREKYIKIEVILNAHKT